MSDKRANLEGVLDTLAPVAVAVSGGVDSVTLAVLAGRRLGPERTLMAHAVSPAVPAEATRRVEAMARREGWTLRIVEAGEFRDPDYLRNPVNRCFFCKTNLYGVIARATDWGIVSGANVDDLGEYRPGLKAAADHGVRHPYVEAGLAKADVRALARALELGDVADLPASPCLASRVETGIPIEAASLALIHRIERLVDAAIQPATVRCRIRAEGLVIELDAAAYRRLKENGTAGLSERIRRAAGDHPAARGPRFAPYRVGSAFLVNPA